MSTTSPQTTFITRLREEMDAGLKMAADPANANLPELALRITTLHSAWYMDTCRVCRNKFREGDRVRLCPRCGRPHHDDAQFNLSCWQDHYGDGGICTEGRIDRFHGHEIEACSYRWNGRLPDAPQSDETPEIMPAPAAVNQFVAGLRDVWRPFGDKQIYKVRPGDAMVGRNCPWCRLRIRAGDWVVSCPCGCGTYFHEDIFRHLTCWNEWNGVEGNDYCPNTARSYDEEEER